ncbi:MAG: NADH-quinone oxidoreductase subunit N [Deltaproteobacteria bacterium]|nr:MAG: NADH-quinone oxidoreductase subunit N [Deltaproteobacteria bacterium]
MREFLPEAFTLGCFLLYLVLSMKKRSPRLGALAVGLSFLGFLLSLWDLGQRGEFFNGAYRVDGLSQVFKVIIALGLFLVFGMGKEREDAERGYGAEFYAFLTLSAFGLMVLVSACELLTLFLALELSSYSLYLVLPLRREMPSQALEGGVKYLLFGAMASGITLYGMGYLYALSGSTRLEALVLQGEALEGLALILVFCGLFFKLSLFPFHFWAPDVYQGASNPTAAFIAGVPKVGALAVLLRFVALTPETEVLIRILWVFSALSMTFGNLSALVQRDLKRLLAYSGIAHAGYLMLGIISFEDLGRVSATYYVIVYLFMTLGAFMAVLFLLDSRGNPSLDDLRGLYRRSPLLAFTLAVSAFSLVGIPPTGGFMGKLLLFTSAFKAGYLYLVIIGAVNTALSLFYYLNLVRLSYCREPEGVLGEIRLGPFQKALCLGLIAVIIYLGLFPTVLERLLGAALTT